MTETRTTWNTEDEIKFVKHIGTWGFAKTRRSEFPKLTLLEKYLHSSIKRTTFGKDVDKKRLIYFIESEIDNEKKRLEFPKLPAVKTKAKRRKKQIKTEE
jgi:hypothetical protein